ncbi:beta-glucuronosyltransferase GlcAT14B-like [Senna tora]|uniref:Beta-glucuronosyltransferase GlcAT14B-like n=1 Tax=Senna tora TaxID=362788 RepID=A0A834TK08_9FABA|nr:beta-glucuronosyltransferase GlcAT14B-like [Senna tora]
MGSINIEKKWLLPLCLYSAVFIYLLASSFTNNAFGSSITTINSFFFLSSSHVTTNQTSPPPPSIFVETSAPAIPRFAYLISGSKGDLEKLWRTLFALYHPLNHYVVHLDLESPLEERLELASRIENQPLFAKIGNVFMNQKANMVTYTGPTMVSNTLHACAILLKRSKDWDWFINLSASDYPLVTQDDLLFTFKHLDRNLNFIEHTSNLGWKLYKRAMPLIVDPGLYMSNKSDIFLANPKRALPTAFKLFTGSAWMVLSRSFVEYVLWGWDNLPRTLLMYYTNFVSSPEAYFQTVICNEPDLAKTAVNTDLHYISWGNPPRQHPQILSINDTHSMIASNAAFARKFHQDDPVLDLIDKDLLHREAGRFTPGAWCSGTPTCSEVGNLNGIEPGPGALRLRALVTRLVLMAKLGGDQCK